MRERLPGTMDLQQLRPTNVDNFDVFYIETIVRDMVTDLNVPLRKTLDAQVKT